MAEVLAIREDPNFGVGDSVPSFSTGNECCQEVAERLQKSEEDCRRMRNNVSLLRGIIETTDKLTTRQKTLEKERNAAKRQSHELAAQLQVELPAVRRRLDALEQAVSSGSGGSASQADESLRSQVKIALESSRVTRASVDRIQSRVDSFDAQLRVLRSSKGDAEAIAGLERRVSATEAKLSGVLADLEAVKTTVAGMSLRVQELENACRDGTNSAGGALVSSGPSSSALEQLQIDWSFMLEDRLSAWQAEMQQKLLATAKETAREAAAAANRAASSAANKAAQSAANKAASNAGSSALWRLGGSGAGASTGVGAVASSINRLGSADEDSLRHPVVSPAVAASDVGAVARGGDTLTSASLATASADQAPSRGSARGRGRAPRGSGRVVLAALATLEGAPSTDAETANDALPEHVVAARGGRECRGGGRGAKRGRPGGLESIVGVRPADKSQLSLALIHPAAAHGGGDGGGGDGSAGVSSAEGRQGMAMVLSGAPMDVGNESDEETRGGGGSDVHPRRVWAGWRPRLITSLLRGNGGGKGAEEEGGEEGGELFRGTLQRQMGGSTRDWVDEDEDGCEMDRGGGSPAGLLASPEFPPLPDEAVLAEWERREFTRDASGPTVCADAVAIDAASAPARGPAARAADPSKAAVAATGGRPGRHVGTSTGGLTARDAIDAASADGGGSPQGDAAGAVSATAHEPVQGRHGPLDSGTALGAPGPAANKAVVNDSSGMGVESVANRPSADQPVADQSVANSCTGEGAQGAGTVVSTPACGNNAGVSRDIPPPCGGRRGPAPRGGSIMARGGRAMPRGGKPPRGPRSWGRLGAGERAGADASISEFVGKDQGAGDGQGAGMSVVVSVGMVAPAPVVVPAKPSTGGCVDTKSSVPAVAAAAAAASTSVDGTSAASSVRDGVPGSTSTDASVTNVALSVAGKGKTAAAQDRGVAAADVSADDAVAGAANLPASMAGRKRGRGPVAVASSANASAVVEEPAADASVTNVALSVAGKGKTAAAQDRGVAVADVSADDAVAGAANLPVVMAGKKRGRGPVAVASSAKASAVVEEPAAAVKRLRGRPPKR
eukprot:jgi/Mesvir1/14760/Mv26256-RA.1